MNENKIFKSKIQQRNDPLEFESKAEALKSEKKEKSAASCTVVPKKPIPNLLNDVVDTIIQRLKNPVEIIVGVSDTVETKTKVARLQPGETTEAQEKRLLRNRLLKFKSRLLQKIEKPAKAEAAKAKVTVASRIRREKRFARETPTETEARKQRAHMLSIASRKRTQELETPEQKAERMAIDREKGRLRLHKKRATETPAERLARKQRQRDYQRNRRPQSLAMRTGKFHGEHKKKRVVDKSKESEKEIK